MARIRLGVVIGGLLVVGLAPAGGMCFLEPRAWSVISWTEAWEVLKAAGVTLWTVKGIGADFEE